VPNPLVNLMTPQIRQKFYIVYAAIGFLLTATQVALSAVEQSQPKWFIAVLAVFAFVGSAFGVTAASNVQTGKQDPNPPNPAEVNPVKPAEVNPATPAEVRG